MAQPHFVRFAQALALVGGLAACGNGSASDDAPRVVESSGHETAQSDGVAVVPTTNEPTVFIDGPFDCASCVCPGVPGPVVCPPTIDCGCSVPGPLPPPDLFV